MHALIVASSTTTIDLHCHIKGIPSYMRTLFKEILCSLFQVLIFRIIVDVEIIVLLFATLHFIHGQFGVFNINCNKSA